MPMSKGCRLASQIKGVLEVFCSEVRTAPGQRMKQRADRSDTHNAPTALAVVASRLANVDNVAQSIDAGAPWCPSREKFLLLDQPAAEQKLLVLGFMFALRV